VTQLEQEIATARRQVVADGYDMSMGELISLYKNKELIINPTYQRLFRWEESQKNKIHRISPAWYSNTPYLRVSEVERSMGID